MRTVIQVVGGLAAVLVVGGLAFVWSFRAQFRPVLTMIRRINRRLINPKQLRSAGQPGAYASVVHHRGRSTGTPYRTPAVALPTDDGFVFALPYGRDVDWVRNLVAAGGARLEHEGETIAVTDPTFPSRAEADRWFPANSQREHRLYALENFLHVRRAG